MIVVRACDKNWILNESYCIPDKLPEMEQNKVSVTTNDFNRSSLNVFVSLNSHHELLKCDFRQVIL